MVYINAVRARKHPARSVGQAVLAGWCVLSASAAWGSEAVGVRSSNRVMTAVIDEGCNRSASFRRLFERIEESNGIVYVEFGHCALGHLNGCLLPFVVPASGVRYLRIVVTPDGTRTNHDGLIALVAHELQHALEVLAHPEVVDVDTMQAMYGRIGRPLAGRHGYETTDAHAAQDAVLSELTKRPGVAGAVTTPSTDCVSAHDSRSPGDRRTATAFSIVRSVRLQADRWKSG
jgi:hypothetical protein